MVYTIGRVQLPRERGAALWKLYLVSFLASLPFFVHGAGTAVLATPEHAGPVIESVQVPCSTVASIVSSLVAAPLCALIINRYGRKIGLYAVAILQGITCILQLALVPVTWPGAAVSAVVSAVSSAVVGAVSGAAAGCLFLTVPVYVREVGAVGAEGVVGARGVLMSLIMPMTSAGNALQLLLPTQHMLYLMIGIVAVEIFVILFIPESPAFYVKVDKLQDAKTSIASLACLECEDTIVCNETSRLQRESERARATIATTTNTTNTATATATHTQTLCAIFKNQIYRAELKLGLTLSTTAVLGGCTVFLDRHKTLAGLGPDSDPGQALVPLSLLAGAAACVLLIGVMERKYLLAVAYSVMVLSMGTLAVYTQTELTVTSLRWVPVAALTVLVASYGAIWGMPTILMAEILNLEIRAGGVSAMWVFAQCVRLVHTLTQQHAQRALGVHALLYLFAGVNMFGAVYAACALPGLRAATAAQLERRMRRAPLP